MGRIVRLRLPAPSVCVPLKEAMVEFPPLPKGRRKFSGEKELSRSGNVAWRLGFRYAWAPRRLDFVFAFSVHSPSHLTNQPTPGLAEQCRKISHPLSSKTLQFAVRSWMPWHSSSSLFRRRPSSRALRICAVDPTMAHPLVSTRWNAA
jgi:hypothetical protein